MRQHFLQLRAMSIKQWVKTNIKPPVLECLLLLEIIAGPLKPHKHFKESFFLWLANSLPRSHRSDRNLRSRLLAKAGVKISGGVVWDNIEIRPLGAASRIKIGQGCFINSGVRFECASGASIEIGNGVQIGPRCAFETMNHSVELIEGKKRGGFPKSIVIEDKVWLAACVTVLPGVRIGKASVVAAGAVVTKDVPPYTLVGGVPARVIREIKSQSLSKPSVADELLLEAAKSESA